METHYTIKEVCETLRLADSTVRRYIREGKMRAVKIGSVWRISESAIAEFLSTDGGMPDKGEGT